MGVEDPLVEFRKELRPKNSHESGGYHQVRRVSGGGGGDGGVPSIAAGVIGDADGEGGHRRLRGDLSGPAIPIDPNGDDSRRVVGHGGVQQ